MCGICGFAHGDPSRPVDASIACRMRDAITHRGPDGAGHARRGRRRARPPSPEHHRPHRRSAAARERGRHGLGHVQRGDLQFPRGARRIGEAGPPVPHALRHRSARARIRGVGRRIREAAEWDVRVRHSRRPPRSRAARARPSRHQAALLLRPRRHALFRLRDQGDSRRRAFPPECVARACRST